MFLADTANDRVLVFDLAAAPQLDRPSFALTGFAAPTGLACDGVRLAVADTGNNRVVVWDALPTGAGSAPWYASISSGSSASPATWVIEPPLAPSSTASYTVAAEACVSVSPPAQTS